MILLLVEFSQFADMNEKTFYEMEITKIRESSESVTKYIKWKIDYEFVLSGDIDNPANSQIFRCGDASWCLQMYSNSERISSEHRWLGLALVRRVSFKQEKKVDYKLGFQTRDGQVGNESKGQHIFNEIRRRVSKFIIVNSLVQRKIIRPDGDLTVFCEICVHTSIPNRQMVDVLTGQVLVPYHYKEVKWNIPNFEDLKKEADYYVESSVFFCGYCNWNLRIYPNGRTGHGRQGQIRLALLRHLSTKDIVQTSFTLVMKTGIGGVYKVFSGEYIFDDNDPESSAFEFGERSKEQRTIVSNKGVVTIFCKIRITLISGD